MLQKELKNSPIGLEEAAAELAVEALLRLLSQTYLLAIKTQNYHWNITGVHFQSLHALFEEQYNEFAPAIDEIAERVRQIGYFVPATTAFYSDLAGLPEQSDQPSATEMLQRLLNDNVAIAKTLREALSRLQEAGVDDVTLDSFIQRTAVHDKNAWMLRSHLSQ